MDRIEIDLAQGWSKGLTIAFENIASGANLKLDDFLHVEQVHGNTIHQVGVMDLNRRGALAKADGLVAFGDTIKNSRRGLLVKTADCVPLVYVDAKSEAVAILHAGWRGLQNGIHRLPFENKSFDPKTTWVWVGPSLSGHTFEVDEDMYSQFPDYKNRSDVFEPITNGKRLFHSWRFIEVELQRFGVELVYNFEVDTFLDKDFASYRRARSEGLEKSPASNYTWVKFNL